MNEAYTKSHIHNAKMIYLINLCFNILQEVPKIPRKENTREFPGQMQKKSHKFRVGSLH